MTKISNVRKTTKFKRSIRAISPVIATLLMIAIAVVASLVVYAWVTGYIGGTTSTAGKAIQIQSFASDPVSGNLVVYVQNVGQGDTQLDKDQSVYVNDNLVSFTSATQRIPLAVGQTVALQTNFPYAAGTKVTIKVTTTDGTFMTTTGTGTSSNNPTPGPGQYQIVVTQTSNGNIAPGTSSYDAGSTPTFTITPSAGYHIASISANGGAVTVTTPAGQSYQFAALSADGTLTATYAQDAASTVPITITSSITGAGFVTVDSTAYATPHTFDWIPGGSHTIAALSPVSGGAGRQYVYTSWSDSGAQSHSYTVPGSAATVTATYKTQYQFTVTSAAGTPTGQSSGWYDAGTSITSSVSATLHVAGPPIIDYTSTGHTGTGSATSSGTQTITFTINAASTVTWNWHGIMKLYPEGNAGTGSQNIPSRYGNIGSNNYAYVSDYSATEDTAYIYASSGSSTYTDYYTTQDHGSASGTINSVTVTVRGERSGSYHSGNYAQITPVLRLSGTILTGTSASTMTSSWDDYSYAYSRSWTWDDVNALQCGVSLQRNGYDARCTLVTVVVDFNA